MDDKRDVEDDKRYGEDDKGHVTTLSCPTAGLKTCSKVNFLPFERVKLHEMRSKGMNLNAT